jgi:hypothetical protein
VAVIATPGFTDGAIAAKAATATIPLAQQWQRDSQAERLGGLEVDDELEFGRVLDGQLGRLGAFQDLVDVGGGSPELLQHIRRVGHETAGRRIILDPVGGWQTADRWRRRKATGDMIIVRYADDFIVGFQHEADARRFWDDMRKRFEEFSLSLNPDKTRLIEFGRFAAERRAQRGLAKPETFNFLGFTFICERNSRGQFLVKRITRRDRMRATLREIKEELRRRMHRPIPEQGAWIKQVVRGFFAYHAVPTNGAALRAFYYYVKRIWLRTLRRRSQKDRFSWQQMHSLAADWIPQPRILHPYPDKRFAVTHPRWEPCAGIPPARIWAGGG